MIGYARISTTTQDLRLQIQQLKNYGCDIVFSEVASGYQNPSKQRELDKAICLATEIGEPIVVVSLDRISRRVDRGMKVYDTVGIISLNDGPMTREQVLHEFELSEAEAHKISKRTKASLTTIREEIAWNAYGVKIESGDEKAKMKYILSILTIRNDRVKRLLRLKSTYDFTCAYCDYIVALNEDKLRSSKKVDLNSIADMISYGIASPYFEIIAKKFNQQIPESIADFAVMMEKAIIDAQNDDR